MAQAAPAVFKIPTKSPQPARGNAAGAAARSSSWSTASPCTPRAEPGRWRAVWYEDGERQQCEASSEEKLADRLEKVTERLAAARRT